ncbi:MAG TPA: glycosyltransferase [Patescibacteria group bacterium]|nr:glycosyltransferase [Patescibacteria group bacterium]
MKISVVIPAFNEEKYLAACLQSLKEQTEKPDEIIVVDNNSTDNTAGIARSFGARVVNEKIQGMIPARNLGFDEARYDIIARTDADTYLPKNWLKQIKNAFQDNSLFAYSGPATWYKVPKTLQPFNWQTRIWFEPFKAVFGHDCLFGPNMALRKSAWELVRNEVCLKDSIVHEDMDLAYHIGKYGKIKFDPKHVIMMSPRRWKKVYPYILYGYRNIRTIQHHRDTILQLHKRKEMVKKVLPKTKRTIKKVAQTVRHPFRYL